MASRRGRRKLSAVALAEAKAPPNHGVSAGRQNGPLRSVTKTEPVISYTKLRGFVYEDDLAAATSYAGLGEDLFVYED